MRTRNWQKRKGPAGPQYVVCVKDQDYPTSLELRKIYRLLSDISANRLGMVRIIDESGEDYLYPEDYFLAIKLTTALQRAVRSAS